MSTMISHSSLKTYLDLFGGPQRSRGYKLYKKKAVRELNNDHKNQIITAKVQGGRLYDVKIRYISDTAIASGTCSCPFRSFCKHQVALIETILSHKKIRDISNGQPKPKPKITVITKPKIKTNQFHKIDVSNSQKFSELVMEAYNRFRYRPHDQYVCEIVDENKIYGFAKRESRFTPAHKQAKFEKVSVEFKRFNGYFSAKCHECSQGLNHWCIHVTSALNGLMYENAFLDFGRGKFDFDKTVRSLADDYSISPEFLRRNFRIVVDRNTFGLLAKQENIPLGSAWNNHLLALNDLAADLSVDQCKFLSIKEDEYEKRSGNALVWSGATGDRHLIVPRIIQGTQSKDKSKLTTHIKEVNYPSLVDEEKLSFYYDLKKTFEINQHFDNRVQLHLSHQFLSDQMQILSSWIHYSFESNYGYHRRSDEIKKSALSQFSFSEVTAELRIEVSRIEGNYTIRTFIKLDAELVPLERIQMLHPLFVLVNFEAHLYSSPDVFFYLANNLDKDNLIIDSTPNPTISGLLYKLSEKFEVGRLPDFLKVKSVELKGGQRKLIIREAGNILTFEPILIFPDTGEFNILKHYSYVETVDNQPVAYILNNDEKSHFIDFMDESHVKFKEERYEYEFYFLPIEDALRGNWFLDFFDNCRSHGIELFGEDLLKNFKFNKNKAVISNSVKSGIDWFDVNVDMSFGKEKVSTSKWIEAIRNKEKYVQLKDGTLGVLPEQWLSRLRKLAQMAELQKGQLQVSKLSFNVVEELFEELGEEEIVEEIRTKKEKLKEFEAIKKLPIPKTVKAKVRDYQQKGFHWLKFLDEFNFGGCLADDMGLGKTLQIIAFLADQKKQKRSTSLVVVPRSLLFNWAAEIDKFCSSLKYYTHHGPLRHSKKVDFSKYDLIISTYDTITIDIEMIRDFEFNYCILDESQAIKNPNSKRYKAMRLINSRNRLVMTGTPIENNTFDLYGQFSFINPGLFMSQSSFRDKFSIPIDARGDQEAADLLRKTVYPFLLRRTKEQVAKDLPDKTESILMCTMGEKQRRLYDELKNTIKADIENKIEADGLNKSKIKILEGLLRLRQMCNSPLLISAQLNGQRAQSAKIEMLLEHITEVIVSHKALIFSQFVTMLALIKAELDKKKIKYAYLDGSTRDRAGSVNQFETDEDCKIFLLSLKAGNTGLNLVSAEYVYMVDPWWNPAVEAQAIDRTHRIGQEKNVFAYKLICKDTIEEKILKLQEKKKKIASDIIRSDENILKSLTKENLMTLFE